MTEKNELEIVCAEADEKNKGSFVADLRLMGEQFFSILQKEANVKLEKKEIIEIAAKKYNITKATLESYATMKMKDEFNKDVFFRAFDLFE